MILLGCRPEGRHTEQHDIFFTIAESLADARPAIRNFWPDGGTLHIDAWRSVRQVGDYRVQVVDRADAVPGELRVFFVNLGGYKPGEFEEFHYKMVVAARDKSGAIAAARRSAFYKHTGFKGAESHIDDKYGIDVDDIADVLDILPVEIRERYALRLEPAAGPEDELHLGYLKWSRIGQAR
ncbi:DUF1543 domain-containing protein [Flaviaesturariibacter aridisoli]|uniref:DUF1543 domain-containing protein n=2 Tax=Flaviaesturariibacter aridisoli TaxID=2545761 RepID=A0A4R4E631_9BACT|nr:DUF1543 domain-containing protein [Flaviaesturariibacter aridisoli]